MPRRVGACGDGPPHAVVLEAEPQGHQAQLHSTDREVAVFLAVSRALVDWEDFERDGERLLRDIAAALGLPAGALWLPREDALVARVVWGASSIERAALASALGPTRVPMGVGLPGCVWQRRVPMDEARSTARESVPQRQAVVEGLRAALGFPALAGEEVLGVIELYSDAKPEFSTRLMQVLSAAGHVLGAVFARRRGELQLSPLTPRELQVLKLVAQGFVGREIAAQLQSAPRPSRPTCHTSTPSSAWSTAPQPSRTLCAPGCWSRSQSERRQSVL